jgi:hypothetical protein
LRRGWRSRQCHKYCREHTSRMKGHALPYSKPSYGSRPCRPRGRLTPARKYRMMQRARRDCALTPRKS